MSLLRAAGAGAKFLLLFGTIWAVVPLTLGVVFIFVEKPVWHDWILDDRARTATARPTGVDRTSTTVNRARVHEIHLVFETPDGTVHRATCPSTDQGLIASARAGEPVVLEYDPEAPSVRHRVQGGKASVFGLMVLIPLAMGFLGLALAGWGWRSAAASRAIHRHGRAAEAVVESVEQTSMTINRRQVMAVRYSFRGLTGRHEGTCKTTTPPRVGERVWVLYDSEAPERSVLAPR